MFCLLTGFIITRETLCFLFNWKENDQHVCSVALPLIFLIISEFSTIKLLHCGLNVDILDFSAIKPLHCGLNFNFPYFSAIIMWLER
ncbi:9634_t:CDS:2 [Cetraspora pellucida]|uniref:9634_t:CDS:1 n=1 Tax=Cetraspora pellucida TaxID=1433469 RepID=A0ACA9JXC9_9GLOM|nr:9634_t:CDS:2 [Cetraspora pellucida]